MAGFDQYQGSGDVTRLVATIEGPDGFPAQGYYVYAPGTYLDPSHQIFYPYLYYPLPTTFYADATAMPAAVPMRIPHTLMSAVENWVPRHLGLEACREITTHGIGHHLWSLELHNYANSPQRWSEFPDADHGDVETLDRYQTAGADFHHLLSGDSLLRVPCKRCETLCDLDLKIAIQKRLQYALLTDRVTKLDEDVFGVEDKLKDPTTREIFNAYRGFRALWHLLLLACHIDPHRFDQDGHAHINQTPLWGDLMTDMTLLGKGFILEQHINFVYGISARGADYLYRWQSEWQREILWLDTYAGVFRHQVSERAPFRDHAAIKIGCTLEFLVEAEQQLDGSYENLRVYKETKIQVRALFRELHISLMHPVIDLPLM